MDSQDLKQLISILLRSNIEVSDIKEIGNSIHLFIEDNEFVVVVKTTTPERRLDHKSPYIL